MSAIEKEQVQKIAELSRLSLSEDETTLYTEQLGKILEYASHLPELPETLVATGKSLRLEEDRAMTSDNPHAFLRNAVTDKGYVKVPAILDKGDS